MRWPWQPRPGMVRVSSRKLIPMLQNALRAHELQAEISRLWVQTREAEAQVRAMELMRERVSAGHLDEAARRDVLAALPLTSDGLLHEPAFLALVEQRVWAGWELQLQARDTTPSAD